MELLGGILLGIFVLTILVAAHEYGHGVVARRNGVKVEEFGIGFPPKAASRIVNKSILGKDVIHSVNWLPLGGFVRLQGEHDSAQGEGTYGNASFWQKTKILLAGVTVNWLIAVLLFTVLAWVGLPKIIPNQFTVPADTTVVRKPVQLASVVPELPAEKSGLIAGDKIIRFDGQKIETTEELSKSAEAQAGKTISVIYSRNNKEANVSVTLRPDNEDGKGYLGASLRQEELIKATWSAPVVGAVTTLQLTGETFASLGKTAMNALSGLFGQLSSDPSARQSANDNLAAAGNAVAGPVGIFGVIFPAAGQSGLLYVLLLTAVISLTLAVINILPIPGLDGGRWFLTAAFKLMKKPLTEEIEAKVNGIGMLFLVGLIILVTIADIGKLVG